MSLSPDRECPVDLDYPEAGLRLLDLGSIRARSQQIRRRRALARAGAALVAVAAIAGAIAGARGYALGGGRPVS